MSCLLLKQALILGCLCYVVAIIHISTLVHYHVVAVRENLRGLFSVCSKTHLATILHVSAGHSVHILIRLRPVLLNLLGSLVLFFVVHAGRSSLRGICAHHFAALELILFVTVLEALLLELSVILGEARATDGGDRSALGNDDRLK